MDGVAKSGMHRGRHYTKLRRQTRVRGVSTGQARLLALLRDHVQRPLLPAFRHALNVRNAPLIVAFNSGCLVQLVSRRNPDSESLHSDWR